MKKFLLLILITPFFSNAQTGQLYGLYLGTSITFNSNVGTAAVDPETAVVDYHAAFENTKIYAFGDHAVDPGDHSFFQLTGDSVNMYLLNFDVDAGTLNNILFQVDSVGDGTAGTVTVGGEIDGTFYNCFDDGVYFFYFRAPYEPYVKFTKADRSTGDITVLDSFPLGIQVIDNLVVPTHQFAYWLTYDNVTYAMDTLVAY